MRIAIVDDVADERALLRGRLEKALNRRSVHADFFEYGNGAAFLAAADADIPDTLTPEAFGKQKLLLREVGSGTREVFADTLTSHGIAMPEPMWESLSTAALLHAAAEGLGIAVVPKRMADGYPGLKQIEIAGIAFRRKYKIIYHRHKYLTDAARAFMELCHGYNKEERKVRL